MRSTLATLGLLLLSPLAFPACDKDDSKGTSPAASSTTAATPSASAAPAVASAAPSASASAAGPPPPKCPAGLTGNPVPAFCIKLPSTYKVKDARISPEKGSIAYDTGTPTDNLMVSYDKSSITDQVKDVTSEMKFGGDKLEKQGDLPGGNKWFQGSHQDFEHVVTLVKGPAPLTLKCSFTYKPKSAPSKDAIEACKSIVLP
jgi:hypothetical protein